MKEGVIKDLHKNGFGYISFDDEPTNIFFHCSQVRGKLRFDRLERGMKVTVKEIVDVEYKGEKKREAKEVSTI